MALANCAWLLASLGNRVVVVDWDLEAPGLHRYFSPFLPDASLTYSEGVIDFLFKYAIEAVRPVGEKETEAGKWYEPYTHFEDYAVTLEWDFGTANHTSRVGSIALIPAGQQVSHYATKVNSFGWNNFYDNLGGRGFLDAAIKRLRDRYDYVLIDSRTGVSDTAGTCTVQLPDALLVFFTLNNQSIDGAEAVARSVLGQRDASQFNIFPVPTRIDNSETNKLSKRWDLAKRAFHDLPQGVEASEKDKYWDEVSIPYVPYYAYEELLSPIANQPGDPGTVNLLPRTQSLLRHAFGLDVHDEMLKLGERERSIALQVFEGNVTGKTVKAVISEQEERARLEEEERKRLAEEAERRRLEEEELRQQRESDAVARAVAESRAKDEAAATFSRRVEGEARERAMRYDRAQSEDARLTRAQVGLETSSQLSLSRLLLLSLGLLFLVGLIWTLVQSKEPSQAQKGLGDSLSAEHRESLRLAEARALSARESNDTEGEIAALNEIIRLKPRAFEYYHWRGKLRIVTDKAGGIADLDKAAQLSGNNPEVLVGRANILASVGEDSLAFEAYMVLLQARPSDPAALMGLAGTQKRLGNPDQAIETLNRLLELEPTNLKARIERAEILAGLNKRDAAIKDYRWVIADAPSSNEALVASQRLKSLGAGGRQPANITVTHRIALQFWSPDKPYANALAAELRAAKFKVDTPELKDRVPAKGEVRYFYAEDVEAAARAKAVVERGLASRALLINLELRKLDVKTIRDPPPRGLIEVWLPRISEGKGTS
ncbi:MAG: tetratricopeptide repeat protein [Betaproteobacteria bacterium]|nr:tetratricopeptide repeat protein [Betaproteobacteria bacterium]